VLAITGDPSNGRVSSNKMEFSDMYLRLIDITDETVAILRHGDIPPNIVSLTR